MKGNGQTGRIKVPITPGARRILFEREFEQQVADELPFLYKVDCAHLLMLAETKIVSKDKVRRLLAAICHLKDEGFSPIRHGSPMRGLFLHYENYLIEREGSDIGGILQTGRSRNDLNATLVKLRLRNPLHRLVKSMLRLQAIFIRRARLYSHILMPAYTHGQPAEPITYGHYLIGVAEAFDRDIVGLLEAARGMETCPLGSGAVAGSTLPIDSRTTAQLLGFKQSATNSVDAVASRDLSLRLLAAAAISGVTLSRVATDLLQWMTDEFQFLQLPDMLVGSSSAMPQKRNPFLLEHVQGRSAAAVAGFVNAVASARNAPFTNSIAVGTESLRSLWGALNDMADATTLLRLVVSGAVPNRDRMLRRASESFTNATEIAVHLAITKEMDFRSAHTKVGEIITEAISRGMSSLETFASLNPGILDLEWSGLDPASVVARSRYGGGPAVEAQRAALQGLEANWRSHRQFVREQAAFWAEAEADLQQCVEGFLVDFKQRPSTSSDCKGDRGPCATAAHEGNEFDNRSTVRNTRVLPPQSAGRENL